jgi:YYY domain-containing protein
VSWIEAAGRWYAVLAFCTWAFAPLVKWLCAALNDRGVAVARPIGLLAAIYPAWLLTSLGIVTFSNVAVVATVVLGAAVGWAIMAQRGGVDRTWLRYLAVADFASLMLFVAYLGLRGFTPAIIGTEKPMDIAFLASSARSVAMPPPDPWFAGEPINYYYLGYLLHGTVSRLAAVPTESGFNLALATIFSTTTVAAFGVGWNAVRPWLGPAAGAAAGTIAAFLLSLAGNLYAPWRLLQNAQETVNAWWWDSGIGIGWRSSRIVCDGVREGNLCPFPATETINEFPFFSFLLGDLHPHVMALPYTIAAIALAWNLADRRAASPEPANLLWNARIALTGVIVGALYALNAWDLPTFLLICVAASVIGSGLGPSRRGALVSAALLVLFALDAWLPFIVTYDAPYSEAARSALPSWLVDLPVLGRVASTLALHSGPYTSLDEYFTIFGVPYVLGTILIAADLIHAPPETISSSLKTALIAAVATIVPGVLLSAPVLPLCGIPLALAVDRLMASPTPRPRTFAFAAFSCAWLLSIGVELIYVQDVFNSRMNTLFKFYYQAWTFYALAAGVTVTVLWALTARLSWPRLAVAAVTTGGIIAGLAYPIVASYQWTDAFQRWQGIDGLAFGEETGAGEVAAIQWLATHARPEDVVLEAAGCSYGPLREFGALPFNRVSAFTGIPTVIGWENHERQWRAGQPALLDAIGGRQQDVAQMFADPASPLIERYGVRWLFVGDYEAADWRSECPVAGSYRGNADPDFPGPDWEEAFRSGDTRIYRRIGA